jgi:hypothetical protein
MNVIINGTNANVTLSLTDANGIDWTADFIGNYDGAFTYDQDAGVYRADAEEVAWWSRVIDRQQALDDRIAELKAEYGYDAVMDALAGVDNNDLDDYITEADAALTEAFGEYEEVA